MQQPYYIISRPIASMSAGEISSLASGHIRRVFKTMQVSQYPIVGGEAGTLDHIVTSTLGSFLEVEATAATGEQLIVPIGFSGEGGSPGVIEMIQISRRPKEPIHQKRTSKAPAFDFWGSTVGVGELILDVLDEGAHSVLLAWEEPLARDAGFGMAQALGVKFLDKTGKELDFKQHTPLHEVHSIDLSGRSFQLLASSFFLLRNEGILPAKRQRQLSVEDLEYEQELNRIYEILHKDLGLQNPMPEIDYSGSCIEFGASMFINAKIVDGNEVTSELSNLQSNLASNGGTAFFFASQLEDMLSDKAPASSKRIVQWLTQYNIPTIVIAEQPFKPATATRYKNKFLNIIGTYSLAEVPLFFEPLTDDAPASEHRRYLSARLEKLFNRIAESKSVAA